MISAPPEAVVLDASALVELLLGTELGGAVRSRLRHTSLHAPAHLDAEVISALGRMHRAGRLPASEVKRRLGALVRAPIERHALGPLVDGAWDRRENLRLLDALYVELAVGLDCHLVTTDGRLARAAGEAQLVELAT